MKCMCLLHVSTQYQESATINGWPAAQSSQTADGSGSGMSFTFTDADYIKTYIILPLCHMWAKHIPVVCKCYGYCPSNPWTWSNTDNPRAPSLCCTGSSSAGARAKYLLLTENREEDWQIESWSKFISQMYLSIATEDKASEQIKPLRHVKEVNESKYDNKSINFCYVMVPLLAPPLTLCT